MTATELVMEWILRISTYLCERLENKVGFCCKLIRPTNYSLPYTKSRCDRVNEGTCFEPSRDCGWGKEEHFAFLIITTTALCYARKARIRQERFMKAGLHCPASSCCHIDSNEWQVGRCRRQVVPRLSHPPFKATNWVWKQCCLQRTFFGLKGLTKLNERLLVRLFGTQLALLCTSVHQWFITFIWVSTSNPPEDYVNSTLKVMLLLVTRSTQKLRHVGRIRYPSGVEQLRFWTSMIALTRSTSSVNAF